MTFIRLRSTEPQAEVDLARTYDAMAVGSGTAGGMAAAHVLTSRGMKRTRWYRF